VLSRPQKTSEMVPARIIDRLSTTRPFSTNTIAEGRCGLTRHSLQPCAGL
jgi:hypothetical protein